MTVAFVIVYGLMGAGAAFTLARIALGPSLLDRVVATDTLLVIVSASLAAHAGLNRDPTVVPVLVVVSLLAFVGSVSIARYVGGMLLTTESEAEAEAAREAAGGAAGARIPAADAHGPRED